ncbi:MAG: hypothetical protein WCT35_00175 [Sideroxydans sp.]|jgi:hypothetical protein
MANPYIQLNKESWEIILNSLKETVVLIVAAQPNSDIAQIKEYLKQYTTVINNNSERIFDEASNNIQQYINFYKVSPQEGIYDEFKNIYFLGEAITIFLNSMGWVDLTKIHRKAMLRLLDVRLEVPHKAYRKALSSRIISTIDNNMVEKHFGTYGWYLTYKCLYNAAANQKKQIV